MAAVQAKKDSLGTSISIIQVLKGMFHCVRRKDMISDSVLRKSHVSCDDRSPILSPQCGVSGAT